MRVCPQCGETSDKWRLCGKCGIRLEEYRPDRKGGRTPLPPKPEAKPAPVPETPADKPSIIDGPSLSKTLEKTPPVKPESVVEEPPVERTPVTEPRHPKPAVHEKPKAQPYVKERTFHTPPTGAPFVGERKFADSPEISTKKTPVRETPSGTIKVDMQLSMGTLIKTIAVIFMALGAFFIFLSLWMLIHQKIYQIGGTHHMAAFFTNHPGLSVIKDMMALSMRGHLSAAVWWGIVLTGGGYMLFQLKMAARWFFMICAVLRIIHLITYFYLPIFFSTVVYGYAKHPYFDAGSKISAILFTLIYGGVIYLLTRPAIVAQFDDSDESN